MRSMPSSSHCSIARGRECRRPTGSAARRHRGLPRTAVAIDRAAGKGAVEIDDVQPCETGIRELPRLRRRIVVEHGGARHLAAHQTNAGAILEIDRRIEDHAGHRRARESRRRGQLDSSKCARGTMSDRSTRGIDRVGAPAPIAQPLVEADRGLLGVAQIEVEDGQPQFPAEPLDLQHDAAAEAVAARPRRHERAGQGAGEGLRLVVARRARLSCAEPATTPSRRPTTSRRSGTSSTPFQ